MYITVGWGRAYYNIDEFFDFSFVLMVIEWSVFVEFYQYLDVLLSLRGKETKWDGSAMSLDRIDREYEF
jgi:hypothetical protein